MCLAGSVVTLQAQPRERRKPRSPTVPREKKILGSRYNPNVQVATADHGRTQLSTVDDHQLRSDRPAEQCPVSSAGETGRAGDVTEAAPPKLDIAAAGGAECGPDEDGERLRLARFLAAVEVRKQRPSHPPRTNRVVSNVNSTPSRAPIDFGKLVLWLSGAWLCASNRSRRWRCTPRRWFAPASARKVGLSAGCGKAARIMWL